jgi:hypothetical protein
MELTPVIWTRISPAATFDTGGEYSLISISRHSRLVPDFFIHSGNTSVQEVLYNWDNILQNASTINTGFIVLEHDLFQQTVEVATGYILPDALAHTQPSLTIEPIVKCLNLQPGDAYIETNDNSSNPLPLGCIFPPCYNTFCAYFFSLIQQLMGPRQILLPPAPAPVPVQVRIVAIQVIPRAGHLRAL